MIEDKPVQHSATREDYTKDELEFMFAVQAYIRRSGRKFPSYSEILAVAKSLGYQKVGPASDQ